MVRVIRSNCTHSADQMVSTVCTTIFRSSVFSRIYGIGGVFYAMHASKMSIILESHIFEGTDIRRVVGASDGNINRLRDNMPHTVAQGNRYDFCIALTLGKTVRAIVPGICRLEQRINRIVVYLVRILVGHV